MNVYHQPHAKRRRPEIDEGLDRCMEKASYGKPWTQKAIADECGCRLQYIQQVELNALKHLRNRLTTEAKEITPLNFLPSNFLRAQ